NVSSVAGFWQAPGSVSYCSTKSWMNSFTKGLSLDLKMAGSPVIVQALCPGFTYSEFHDVSGVDRCNIRRGSWMSAEDVVRDPLLGLDEGKLFVVPGWRYKILVFLMKTLPAAVLDFAVMRQKRVAAPQ